MMPGGGIVWPDRLMMLFARDVLARQSGAGIIFDVECSHRLGEEIRACGSQPVMWCTGHALIEAQLKQRSAPLAGEMNGHIFFAERWYGFDDGLYVVARLLEILVRQDNARSGVARPARFGHYTRVESAYERRRASAIGGRVPVG